MTTCLVVETVFEPAGFGLETLQSPSWWQQAEETVRWVDGFTSEAGVINVNKGGKIDTNNILTQKNPVPSCSR